MAKAARKPEIVENKNFLTEHLFTKNPPRSTMTNQLYKTAFLLTIAIFCLLVPPTLHFKKLYDE
jgi:hypothetical protein